MMRRCGVLGSFWRDVLREARRVVNGEWDAVAVGENGWKVSLVFAGWLSRFVRSKVWLYAVWLEGSTDGSACDTDCRGGSVE